MPRKITDEMPLEDLRNEVLFTRAALKADPDASDLLTMTDDWLGWIEDAMVAARRATEVTLDADAARAVANARLDDVCVRFSDKLLMAVGKDRTAARYRQFLKGPISEFTRTALAKQAAIVKTWLAVNDALVTEMKTELEQRVAAVEAALSATEGTSTSRGQVWVAREKLAEDLTRARDGLRDALAARAREKALQRDWPDVFFRVEKRREAKAAGVDA